MELVALAHEFAANEIRPVAAHHDETEEYPAEVIRKAAAVGLTVYDLPEDHGGGGVESIRTQCLIGEELGWGDAPTIALAVALAFAFGYAFTIVPLRRRGAIEWAMARDARAARTPQM